MIQVDRPGDHSEADGLMTSVVGLPLAVRTADCVPVVLHANNAVAVVHAGWRSLLAGVIENARRSLESIGASPLRAAIGPAIGPCCYEVGEEVAEQFGEHVGQTTWGTKSVNLWDDAAARLGGLDVWRADLCTMCEPGFNSYRRDATSARQTTVAWLS